METSVPLAGTHVLVDAKVQSSEVFTEERLGSLFRSLVAVLGMRPLGEPQFYEVPVDPKVLERAQRTGEFEDEGGITGFQVISTSHMSLHAWPLQSYFTMDVYSCKPFNPKLALSVIFESMGVTENHSFVVSRKKPEDRSRGPAYFSLG